MRIDSTPDRLRRFDGSKLLHGAHGELDALIIGLAMHAAFEMALSVLRLSRRQLAIDIGCELSRHMPAEHDHPFAAMTALSRSASILCPLFSLDATVPLEHPRAFDICS